MRVSSGHYQRQATFLARASFLFDPARAATIADPATRFRSSQSTKNANLYCQLPQEVVPWRSICTTYGQPSHQKDPTDGIGS